MKWCEIFRTGKHTDSKGNTREWAAEDLDKICTNFETKNPDVPICVGHPKTNSPAYGWIDKLKTEGGKLYASFKDVQPEFQEAVKKGLFKTRSISLTSDLIPRHIAFLGAQAPAIKGMEQFCFESECENDIVIDFNETNVNEKAEFEQSKPNGEEGASSPSERSGDNVESRNKIGGSTSMPPVVSSDEKGGKWGLEASSPSTPPDKKGVNEASSLDSETTPPDKRKGEQMTAELEKQLAAKDEELAATKMELEKVRQEALKKEFEEFCDNAIADGNILPAQRENVLNLLFANTDSNINFDDGVKGANEVFKDFIKSLRQMDFQQVGKEDDVLVDKEINFSDAESVKESIQALQKEYETKGIELNPARALDKLRNGALK